MADQFNTLDRPQTDTSQGGQSLATRIEVIPRWATSGNSQTLTGGEARFSYFTPPVALTVSQFQAISRGTASAALTLARLGLYTVAANGDITLVARCASDTALFGTTNTLYTKAMDTTGGYPASYALVAGARYAVGVICVGTTMPAIAAVSLGTGVIAALDPIMARFKGSEADLGTTYTNAALTTTQPMCWAALIP